MKRILIIVTLFLSITELHAQHVRVRLSLPVGARVGAPGAAPFRGAVWIGPEWRWQRGQYVSVPGYWARPARFNAVWVPGHWKYTRRGYKWVPGRWR